MSAGNELKVLHDRLLDERPEGATHDEGTCPFCMADDGTHDTTGGQMPETFTQEDVDAAVAAATADLQKRLDELGAQVQDSEIGRAVAEAKAALQAQVDELQAKLDDAEVAKTAAEASLVQTNEFWASAVQAAEEEATRASRRDQRVAAAKELGFLSDEFIAERADRFAAMSDEEFTARIDEWRLVASTHPGPGRTSTAFTAAASPPPSTGSALAAISEFRSKRVDPRTLGGA